MSELVFSDMDTKFKCAEQNRSISKYIVNFLLSRIYNPSSPSKHNVVGNIKTLRTTKQLKIELAFRKLRVEWDMYILGGTSSEHMAKELAKISDEPLLEREIRRFPDGELYVRLLKKVENKDVVIIQNTYPDENIIELFLLQDAVSECNAKNITVVIPYYGYGRQDKKFLEGEAVSAKACLLYTSPSPRDS